MLTILSNWEAFFIRNVTLNTVLRWLYLHFLNFPLILRRFRYSLQKTCISSLKIRREEVFFIRTSIKNSLPSDVYDVYLSFTAKSSSWQQPHPVTIHKSIDSPMNEFDRLLMIKWYFLTLKASALFFKNVLYFWLKTLKKNLSVCSY